MSSNRRGLLLVLSAGAVTLALACGPDFPWQLLDNRALTLKATPNNDFAYELKSVLSPPLDNLRAKEPGVDDDSIDAQRDQAEKEGLSDSQLKVLSDMRASANGDQAYALGAALPVAVRLYTAGAVAYHKGDNAGAAARFQAVLDLPNSEGALRETWSAYMLGRIAEDKGDDATADRYFLLTRDLALHGRHDPLGLAVASYNEDARVHMKRADSYLVGGKLPTKDAAAYGKEMARAANLYELAESRGSGWSFNSLKFVADDILSEPARVSATADDPFVQRLLVTYSLSYVADITATDVWGDEDDFHPHEAGGDPTLKLNESVAALVAAIQAHPIKQTLGQDHLAALMYRTGHYELARDLVAHSQTPIAAWVKAKLAIQKGDLNGAAQFYAQAVSAFKSTNTGLDGYNATRIVGEWGTLALARGDYIDAMDKLWGHPDTTITYAHRDMYWGDIAYIAERVLTTEELKHFVDSHVPVSTVVFVKVDPNNDYGDWANKSVEYATQAAKLRDLLARRLVREGRYSEALPYFHVTGDTHFSDPEIRDHVETYERDLETARGNGPALARAKAWFDAAGLAKKWGMEMMGYESAPDYFSVGGGYDYGYGQSKTGDSFVTADEKKRFAATTAKPDARYHYRFIAVDEVEKAVALVPARGQAYAALLCTASDWMIHTPDQEQRVKDLYHQYISRGALVPWAKSFGSDCQDPNFTETQADVDAKAAALRTTEALARKAAAERHAAWVKAHPSSAQQHRTTIPQTPYRIARHFVSVHRWYFLVAFIVGLMLLTATIIRYRIRRGTRSSERSHSE